jgi:stage II sporulation protein D
LIFEGNGAGHGVGLCQRGAEQMGLAGNSYSEILAFSYPGTAVGLTGRGISWQRLGGETMSLWTTQPDRDRTALAVAERLGRALALRTNWTLPAGIEIHAYPDLDAFRNATGEPGWVAAHTDGKRIHLQPIAVLRSRGVLQPTLSHELLHVLIESQAKPGPPVWFREGLAAFLESGRGTGVPRRPPDEDLRQTADVARARRAYADAEAMVASLVQSYGEVTVLDWVKRGLPPEVTKARASQAAPKSR